MNWLRYVALICCGALLGCTVDVLAGDKGDIVAGKKVFQRATCECCHGGGGNLMNPQKPLRGALFRAKYKNDDFLIQTIRTGISGTAMPGFGKDKISDREMQDLVAYLRSLN